MKTTVKKLSAFLLIFVFVASIINSGCKKKEDPTAPTLPPASSMTMDNTDFQSQQSKNALDAATYSNKNWAVTNVAYFNTLLSLTLAIPVLAFGAALNHTPELQSDDSWKWSYTWGEFSGYLTGKVNGSQAQWDMYLSKTGANAYSNFHWYTGTSNTDGTQGTWTLFKSPQEPVSFLKIDWAKNSNGTCNTKHTIINPTDPQYNSYVSYGITTDSPYNAFYDIYYIPNGYNATNLVNIKWNKTTKEGEVKDQWHFGNAVFHNWSSTGVNL